MSRDYEGLLFGKLVCVKPTQQRANDGRVKWEMRCVDCGHIDVRVPRHTERSEKEGHIISCKGCDRLTPKQVFMNRVSRTYKTNATKRDLQFRLSKQDIKILLESNCHYCGVEPSNVAKDKDYPEYEFVYQGIDRIDNDLDYVPFNVVPCCKPCNTAKSNRDYEDYVRWLKQSVSHLEGRVE